MSLGTNRRRGYAPARELLTVAVWSPLHGRAWMVTPRQAAVLTAITDGYDGTQAALARQVGYSGGGAVSNALRSLEAGGLLIRRTVRGRLGRTILAVRQGVRLIERAAAVVAAVRTILLRRRSSGGTEPMPEYDVRDPRSNYWVPPSKPLEPRSAPVLKSEALDTRRRMVAAIPSGVVRQLMSRHGHGSTDELARCDWCAAAVHTAWIGE